MGFAVDIETDDASPARVAQNIQIHDITLDANRGVSNATFLLAAHAQTITDVHAYGVRHTGGGSGTAVSVSYTVGSGVLDHWSVDGLHVSGGGFGVAIGTNESFTDVHINNGYVEGSTAVNLSNSKPYAAYALAPGVRYTNCWAVNNAGDGWASNFWDGTYLNNLTIGPGVATMDGCYGYNNGSASGGPYYGVNNKAVQTLKMSGCQMMASAPINILPAILTDYQTNTGGADFWATSTGTTSLARDTSTAWPLALLFTASGTSTGIPTFAKCLASPQNEVVKVTGNAWYRFTLAAKPVGPIAEAAVSAGTVKCAIGFQWVDVSGTQIGSAVETQINPQHNGRFTAGFNLAQAPSNAVWVQPYIRPYTSSGNRTSGEQYIVVVQGLSLVTTASSWTDVQAYGLNLAQGTSAIVNDCSLYPNATGRINSAGLVSETYSRDPAGVAPVAFVQAIHSTDGVSVPERDTTGLTSAQIDALFTTAPKDGTELSDPVNHFHLVRQNGKWYTTSALTIIN